MKQILCCALALAINLPSAARGQSPVQFGGIMSFQEDFGDNLHPYNTMFRGDSPFSTVRARIFMSSWVQEHVGVFVQMWLDDEASSEFGGRLRLEGAYAAFTDIGRAGLGFKVGKIPLTVGRFVERAYSDKNSVIGSPLIYSYRTALTRGLGLTNGLLTPGTNAGLPIGYESCWPVGVEHFGTFGRVDYAVAVTNGSMSDPRGATNNDGYQYLGRIGWRPHVSMNLGFNAAWGPYPASLPAARTSLGERPSDFMQEFWGVDFEFSKGPLEVICEYGHNDWDVYFAQDGEVTANTWYADLKWKFATGWYAAVRAEQMLFSTEQMDNRPAPAHWEYDITRVEAGIGYHVTRSVLAKLVEQINHFPDVTGRDTYTTAVQLNITF